MTFRRFEDMSAWQTARMIVTSVYKASQGRKFGRDFGLRDQIRRAAVSIMANIAEGFSHRSDREFTRFLFAAKASAAEVQSRLYVALDQGYMDGKQFKGLYGETEACSKQLAGLISYLLGRKTAEVDYMNLDLRRPADPADSVD